ncbi:50S ribosomal protein L2 [Medicago truncatula]|uniref:50S ribosomal protein L2 n=1 Tax=Medicago truncatula TaxID=3880 RepID=G7JS53_MEDTR|nr:50S ribosomal protein L2 [Medicago truncatula]
MAVHSTSNNFNCLIYGQRHCVKGRNARGIFTGIEGGDHKCLYCKIDFRKNEIDIYGQNVTNEYIRP